MRTIKDLCRENQRELEYEYDFEREDDTKKDDRANDRPTRVEIDSLNTY